MIKAPDQLNQIDIKKFKKGKRINRGGFGVIYSVQEIDTDKTYAAKVIDCNDDEEQCKKMIDREIGIMMTIQHPAIIKFIGYSLQDFFEESNITIIMELAKNGSLADVIKKIQKHDGPKEFTNTSRLIILTGVACGMNYLHNHNIIHRDLKLDNILLDENFYPLITDFGLSKLFESGHSKSQTFFGGTLAYMAPEIIKNEQYDRKADVYAFGIVMFEIATDSIPYPELENGILKEFEFKRKIIEENHRPEFKVPIKSSLQNLIEQCWSSDPEERPTFSEIYGRLKSSSKNNEKNDEKEIFFDDVDDEEFVCYLEKIIEGEDLLKDEDEKNRLQKEIDELKQENELLKQKVTVDAFNSFPLQNQQSVISSFLSNELTFFTKVNELILLLMKFKVRQNIMIQLEGNCKLIECIKSGHFQIQFDSDTTKILFKKKLFELREFTDNLKVYKSVLFNFVYPDIYYPIKTMSNSFVSIDFQETDSVFQGFKNNQKIQCICFGPSIQSIKKDFCYLCKSLVQVSIPNSVCKIENGAFYGCTSLKQINFPSSVTIIESCAFSGCSSLIEISIPSVCVIGDNAFQNCSSMKRIELSKSLATIGKNAFCECTSLEEIELSPFIKVIEESTFYGCKSLKKIVIPSSVYLIGERSFCRCSSLEILDLKNSDSLNIIDCNAFESCFSLEMVIIPKSVKVIKSKAFDSCSSLKCALVDSSTSYDKFGCFHYKTKIID